MGRGSVYGDGDAEEEEEEEEEGDEDEYEYVDEDDGDEEYEYEDEEEEEEEEEEEAPKLSMAELRAKIAKLPLEWAARNTELATDDDIQREDYEGYTFPSVELLTEPETTSPPGGGHRQTSGRVPGGRRCLWHRRLRRRHRFGPDSDPLLRRARTRYEGLQAQRDFT